MSTLRERVRVAAGFARQALVALREGGPTASVAPPATPGSPPQAPLERWGGTRTTNDATVVRELTPARIASYLLAANQGDTRSFAELCQQVQDRDSHIVATLGVRKRAVANLKWRLEPASDDAVDRRIAAECQENIRQMQRLRAGMLGLLDAIMTGYAGAEIDWGYNGGLVVPRRLLYRPTQWLRPDPNDFEAWRVLDAADPVDGVALQSRRWVLHVAQAKSGWPVESGLGRVIVWWYLFKNYAIKDWVSYNEKFGAPLRVGKYPVGAEGPDIDDLNEALQQLGVDAYASIPDDMKVEFIADGGSKTGGDTHERFLNFANREISKVIVGSTLTIEGGPNGTQALGTVHNDVRADIRDADALELQETLTRDLVGPMVAFNYGEGAERPQFTFEIDPAPDKEADAKAQAARSQVFVAARQLGIDVPVSQVREELGIRAPEAGEAVLPPMASAAPGTFRARGGRVAGAARPGEIAAVLQFDSVVSSYRGAVTAAWARIVADLRAELGEQLDVDAVRARLPAFLERLELEPYVDAVASGTLAAEALGLLQARGRDRAVVALPDGSPLADTEAWAEALGLTAADWAARVVRQRDQARDAVRYAVLRTAQDLLAALEGESEEAPGARADGAMDAAKADPHRADAVLETGAIGRWGEGRWEGVTSDPSARYLRYHIVGEPAGDGKNRPTHKAMQGKVYPATHPIWRVWRPPNGYGCRCWVTAHTLAEVVAAGWEITEDFPTVDGQPAVPDAGWQRHHGEADYDWKAFPAEWRGALRVKEDRA